MADPTPLELCTGSTPECPHVECPDDWHWGDDLPCSCTPDCARSDPAPLAPTAEEAIALIRSALDDGLILNRITPAGVPVFWRYDYRALPVSPIARPDWNGGWRNEQENAGHSDGCGGNCGTNDSDNPPCPAQDTQCVWPGCESTDVREWSRRSCEDHYIRADDWWGDDAPHLGPVIQNLIVAARAVLSRLGGYPRGFWASEDHDALDALRAALDAPALTVADLRAAMDKTRGTYVASEWFIHGRRDPDGDWPAAILRALDTLNKENGS